MPTCPPTDRYVSVGELLRPARRTSTRGVDTQLAGSRILDDGLECRISPGDMAELRQGLVALAELECSLPAS